MLASLHFTSNIRDIFKSGNCSKNRYRHPMKRVAERPSSHPRARRSSGVVGGRREMRSRSARAEVNTPRPPHIPSLQLPTPNSNSEWPLAKCPSSSPAPSRSPLPPKARPRQSPRPQSRAQRPRRKCRARRRPTRGRGWSATCGSLTWRTVSRTLRMSWRWAGGHGGTGEPIRFSTALLAAGAQQPLDMLLIPDVATWLIRGC